MWIVCELYVNYMCCDMIDVVIIKSNALPLYTKSVGKREGNDINYIVLLSAHLLR